MALLACARCGKQTVKLDRCTYCTKLICSSCIKSSRRAGKIKKLFICRNCWGNIKQRKRFKSTVK